MKLDKVNKLTNEELEQVAGGNAGECALESEFFNDLGYNEAKDVPHFYKWGWYI